MTAGLPTGFRIELDPAVKQLTPDVLFGGSPARILRLNAAGLRALDELRTGPVASPAGAALARRLTDGNLAHPCPPSESTVDVTVVIPVRDRPHELARCLDALGDAYPVIVVDDGSTVPVVSLAGVLVLRRDSNGGPGAARNTALSHVDTELVAFVDSDCVPPTGWIAELAGHFADPLVGAVAPRVTPLGGADRSALDLGEQRACVAPLTRVSYVPTAAMVVRRKALGDGFDEALRFGEDVDLVWRMIDAGWRVRYEPSVQVGHDEPPDRNSLLHRRFSYGTSAAPLARRHPDALPPLVLQPAPTLTVVALLARRPALALACYGAGVALLHRRLRRADLPADGLVKPTAEAVRQTWLGMGRWTTQYGGPALLGALLRPGSRLSAASLLLGPALTDWRTARPGSHPARFVARSLAGGAAYGAGVWRGCLRERTLGPVLPRISWNPLVPTFRRPRR